MAVSGTDTKTVNIPLLLKPINLSGTGNLMIMYEDKYVREQLLKMGYGRDYLGMSD